MMQKLFPKSPFIRLGLMAMLSLICAFVNAENSKWQGVRIFPETGKLRIEIDGEFFSNYIYENVSRPFFYPVMGPKSLPVTRNWPMDFEEGEAKDHPHHRSLWYAHGEINGHDFWSESDQAGTTQHVFFKEIVSGKEHARIVSFNRLVAKDGTIVATDTREMILYRRPLTERIFDFNITIHASHGDLVLGDTKEGSMAIRLAPTMRLQGKVGEGQIINSEGVIGEATWGKRARWVDYFGPVKGQRIGVAIFDHPTNPRHPTWWHVRKYGLFAANPFGVHDFERRKKGVGDFPVPSGSSVSWRYRFLIHLGNTQTANIRNRYNQYAKVDFGFQKKEPIVNQ